MSYQSALDDRALAQEHLTKALNYQKMGMGASTERELAEALRLDPTLVSDARYQALNVRKADELGQAEARKLPMRVAAVLLLADAGVFVLLWLLNLAAGSFTEFMIWGLVHIGVDLFIAINLLRLKEVALGWTLWWAVLGAIVGVLEAIGTADMYSLVLQLAFSGSLLLLTLGRPSKLRVVIAALVFGVGYLGSVCGMFAWGVLQPFLK